MYIHENKGWNNFTWDQERLVVLLAEVRHLQGLLLGRMEGLGFKPRVETTLKTLTLDVLKTSEIEGESLDADQVRSSLARRLGLDKSNASQIDRNIEGIVEILLDATGNFDAELTKSRLCNWHAALFPTGNNRMYKITVGNWRDAASGKMQVVSGNIGREKIHYEAPHYERLESEMEKFLEWINKKPETDLVIMSAIAHFWFVTIHPFDDGNGRIARAVADMILARSENTSQRFYSMSSQIRIERKAYYDILEKCQKGTSDITAWIEWYLNCLKRAILSSGETLEIVLNKAKFWGTHSKEFFNDRQRKALHILLGDYNKSFTTSRWANFSKCSQDSALRDITDLVERGILEKSNVGGRSTTYKLIHNHKSHTAPLS